MKGTGPNLIKKSLLYYFSVDCEDLLKIDEILTIQAKSIQIRLLCYQIPMHLLKELINIYKLKFKSKPWITLGLQKSISVKNKLLTNFINKKDPVLKKEFHTKYKKYRN